LSVFTQKGEAEEEFKRIVDFVSVEYLEYLATYTQSNLYVPRLRQLVDEEELALEGEVRNERSAWEYAGEMHQTQQDQSGWTEEANRISARGFHQLIILSEESVNAYYTSLWNAARTSDDKSTTEWAYENMFRGTFQHLKLQLLSGDRAIVYVSVENGSMTLPS
jgi:hypothetical protein